MATKKDVLKKGLGAIWDEPKQNQETPEEQETAPNQEERVLRHASDLTPEELEKVLDKRQLRLNLEPKRRVGRPNLPDDKKVQNTTVTMKLDNDINGYLKTFSSDTGILQTRIINDALRIYFLLNRPEFFSEEEQAKIRSKFLEEK